MCQECGCATASGDVHVHDGHGHHSQRAPATASIEVLHGILHENDHEAAHNREHFNRHGVLAVNLMSSPGSGKTALLEATIEAIGDRYRIAVIEGDLETENDAAAHPRQGRAGGADHDGADLPSRRAYGA